MISTNFSARARLVGSISLLGWPGCVALDWDWEDIATGPCPAGSCEDARAVTAGAIHPCANRFLLRTYRAVYEYRAPAGSDFEAAFAAPPVALTDTAEGQGESIEYEADGSGYFTMTEREAAPYPLKRVARQ